MNANDFHFDTCPACDIMHDDGAECPSCGHLADDEEALFAMALDMAEARSGSL